MMVKRMSALYRVILIGNSGVKNVWAADTDGFVVSSLRDLPHQMNRMNRDLTLQH